MYRILSPQIQMLLLEVSQGHQSIEWYLLAVSSRELEVLDLDEPGTNSITLSSRIHIPILKSLNDCGVLSLPTIESPNESQHPAAVNYRRAVKTIS